MRKAQKRSSLYIPRKTVSALPKNQTTAAPLPCEYHQKIATLPLSRFKSCLCDDNLYALVISGTPDPIALLNAWKNIQIEYADKIGDGEHKLYCTILKQVLELEINYKLVLFCIEALRMVEIADYPKAQQFADELNNLVDASFKYSGTDKNKNLDNAFNRAKSIKISIDIQTQRLNAIKKKEGEKRTPESFDSNLITLSDHAGYSISDSIMTFEYCERICRLNHFIASKKTKPYASR